MLFPSDIVIQMKKINKYTLLEVKHKLIALKLYFYVIEKDLYYFFD